MYWNIRRKNNANCSYSRWQRTQKPKKNYIQIIKEIKEISILIDKLKHHIIYYKILLISLLNEIWFILIKYFPISKLLTAAVKNQPCQLYVERYMIGWHMKRELKSWSYSEIKISCFFFDIVPHDNAIYNFGFLIFA